MNRGDGLREPVFATDPRSDELGELQFTLGEGPCLDALNGDQTVLVADLASVSSGQRWPAFAPAAMARGVRGLFSIPIRAGAARLGVLGLYREQAGPLTSGELTDVLSYTDALLVLALDHRGGISPGLEGFLDTEFTERRAGVHQAAGMVSVQLGVAVAEALARLRAHAYAHDLRLTDVSADVVARRLWFHRDTGAAVTAEVPTDPYGGLGGVPDLDNNGNQNTGPLPGTDTTGKEESE